MLIRTNIFLGLLLLWGFTIISTTTAAEHISQTMNHAELFNQNKPENAKIKVKGTGKTIGNVLLLEVTNKDKTNTLRFTVGPALVPGSRKSQPYIIPGTTEVVVPPGGTVTVPIDGICIDPHKPPIRPGSGGPKFEDWIDINPLDDDWTPNPGSGWEPDPNNPVLNPITETPIGHTIDIYSYPEEAAPLISTIVESIITTLDDLISDGIVSTPIENNPMLERELIIQQLVWLTVSELTGNPYTIEDFESRVIDLIPSTDRPVEGSPEEEYLKDDIQDFWGGFKLVGAEAKVLSSSATGVPIGFSPDKSKEEHKDDREVCAVSLLELNIKLEIIKPDGTKEEFQLNDEGDLVVGRILGGSTLKLQCRPEVECECNITTVTRSPRGGTSTQTFTSPCNPNTINYSSFSTSGLNNLTSTNESDINEKLENEEEDRLKKVKEEIEKEIEDLTTQITNNENRINELEGTRDRELRQERDSLRRANRNLVSNRESLVRHLQRNDRDLRRLFSDRLAALREERRIELWKENGCGLDFKVEGRENREHPINATIIIVVNGSCGSDHQDRCKSADFSQTFEINIKSR